MRARERIEARRRVSIRPMKRETVLSVFGGIGLLDAAFEEVGSLDRSQIAPVRCDSALDASQLLPTLTGKSAVTELEAWRRQEWLQRPLALGKGKSIQVIANGVPRPLALAVASACLRRVTELEASALCACGCGRWLPPGRSLFAQECRQRASRLSRFGQRQIVRAAGIS